MIESQTRSKRYRWAMGLAIAAGLVFGAAAPAVAAGQFSVKITPTGCTETDFQGKSWAVSGGATARTWHNAVSCFFGHTQVGARAHSGSAASAWKYANTGAIQASVSGSGSVAGAHRLCAYYYGTLYCAGIRYT
jgi:hypothetical protein